jgi:hypothetical protein
MKLLNGTDIEPGDLIQIDTKYRGRVVASVDTGRYLAGEEGWSYLKVGIMVDTDFGGLVRYTADTADAFLLIERAPTA